MVFYTLPHRQKWFGFLNHCSDARQTSNISELFGAQRPPSALVMEPPTVPGSGSLPSPRTLHLLLILAVMSQLMPGKKRGGGLMEEVTTRIRADSACVRVCVCAY